MEKLEDTNEAAHHQQAKKFEDGSDSDEDPETKMDTEAEENVEEIIYREDMGMDDSAPHQWKLAAEKLGLNADTLFQYAILGPAHERRFVCTIALEAENKLYRSDVVLQKKMSTKQACMAALVSRNLLAERKSKKKKSSSGVVAMEASSEFDDWPELRYSEQRMGTLPVNFDCVGTWNRYELKHRQALGASTMEFVPDGTPQNRTVRCVIHYRPEQRSFSSHPCKKKQTSKVYACYCALVAAGQITGQSAIPMGAEFLPGPSASCFPPPVAQQLPVATMYTEQLPLTSPFPISTPPPFAPEGPCIQEQQLQAYSLREWGTNFQIVNQFDAKRGMWRSFITFTKLPTNEVVQSTGEHPIRAEAEKVSFAQLWSQLGISLPPDPPVSSPL